MLRDQAERRKVKGRPVWSWGTLPTPDDPYPSNVVNQTYSDGTYDTRTPPATNKVIAEYEEAIGTWPDCAELRMEYAFSLSLAGMREQAAEQAQEAVRIRPEWDRARSFLRHLLHEPEALEPAETTLVVAVIDVAGFFHASQGRTDREMFDMLDRYYWIVGRRIGRDGGTVVKFMGDAALAIFAEGHAQKAVDCLNRLQEEVSEIWKSYTAQCHVRYHVHFGPVVIGDLGPARTFDVIGKTVNELFLMPWDGPQISAALSELLKRNNG